MTWLAVMRQISSQGVKEARENQRQQQARVGKTTRRGQQKNQASLYCAEATGARLALQELPSPLQRLTYLVPEQQRRSLHHCGARRHNDDNNREEVGRSNTSQNQLKLEKKLAKPAEDSKKNKKNSNKNDRKWEPSQVKRRRRRRQNLKLEKINRMQVGPQRRQLLGIMATIMTVATLAALVQAAVSGGPQQPQQQQHFEVQPEPQYLVQNGHDARIRCLIRSRQGECSWLRNGRVMGPIAKKYHFVRTPEDGDCSLTIRNVSVQQDDGAWQCQVTAPDVDQEPLQSREVQLVVLVAPERPQIKNTSQHTHRLIVEENKSKFVVCEMRGGNPAPQIEWLLDNKNISKEATTTSQQLSGQQRVTQSRLKMGDIRRTMNGKNLTCFGLHQTLNQSQSVELDVQYVPSVSVVQREYSIVEGSPLSISCQVDANPPPNIVNWRLVSDGATARNQRQSQQAADNNQLALPSRPGPVLEFERISRDLNQNIFECLAQNSYGISLPADVKLNVLYAPFLLNTSHSESVVVGAEAQLACVFDGNPEPEVKWYYSDPLARTPQAQQLANDRQQYLIIKNVTYRNEGDYHCEARNQINGVYYGVRSSNILLDVYGEPQFLLRNPGQAQQARAIQGQAADLSLSFCADPPPNKVYWQFGSLRLEVRLNNGPTTAPTPTHSQQRQPMGQRFQVQPLQALQKRDSSFSKVATCFEATMSILEPELSDQRDYTLVVQNERGHQSAVVRLRVSSPLSPVLMITSAFLTIFGLFLCALLAMFILKRRGGSTRANGQQVASNGKPNGGNINGNNNGVEHLANGNGASSGNGNSAAALATAAAAAQQLMQKQTRGLVKGAGQGLANGSSNPNGSGLDFGGHDGNGLGPSVQIESNLISNSSSNGKLLSMGSNDSSSSGDQRQLLAHAADRQSSSSNSANSTNTDQCLHFESNSPLASASTSSPSPMNHISVDDDASSSTYQNSGDRVQLEAQLAAQDQHRLLHHQSALIYANLSDYGPHLDHSPQTQSQASNQSNSLAQAPTRNQIQAQAPSQQHSPSASSQTGQSITSMLAQERQLPNQQQAPTSPSQLGLRPSVGATIALMNSLAAQAQASALPAQTNGSGVLNGAINQQLANSRQVRKAGPPKPPKPSIQQRSRIYNSSSNNNNNSGLVMIGTPNGLQKGYQFQGEQHELDSHQLNREPPTANELAVEYSRLAFPARAEL